MTLCRSTDHPDPCRFFCPPLPSGGFTPVPAPFPIFGLSGALFPISSLPRWIGPVILIDPLTYGVEGIRYCLTGVSQINPVVCLAVIGGFALAMTMAGAFLFRKITL